ncbi:LOW QUALITY PROTEIN: chemosensory receptor A [Elysia marginata]|uniref:Chemosensory receptor A n=1 Tax=Elysia marginata TaxID=1093978 RepID=A0AAV4FUS9_9GAST|nr:LOW QUALITY PROTEIN: chemosensory receptor A [Elysia marginata]
MGLQENVNITLVVLSISDLMFVLMLCVWLYAVLILGGHNTLVPFPAEHRALQVCSECVGLMFFDSSSFVSVFLAAVRCLCVSRPLKFKSMFTKSRTLVILGVLFSVAVVLNLPIITTIRLKWVANPKTNSTYMLTFTVTDSYQSLVKVHDVLNENIIAWLTYTTIVACVVILASKLQAASKFRRSLASTGERKSTRGVRYRGFPKTLTVHATQSHLNATRRCQVKCQPKNFKSYNR